MILPTNNRGSCQYPWGFWWVDSPVYPGEGNLMKIKSHLGVMGHAKMANMAKITPGG